MGAGDRREVSPRSRRLEDGVRAAHAIRIRARKAFGAVQRCADLYPDPIPVVPGPGGIAWRLRERAATAVRRMAAPARPIPTRSVHNPGLINSKPAIRSMGRPQE